MNNIEKSKLKTCGWLTCARKRDRCRKRSHPGKNDEEVIEPEVPREFETTIQSGSNKNGRQTEPCPSKNVEFGSPVMVAAYWCSLYRHAGILMVVSKLKEKGKKKLVTHVKV